MEADSQPNMSTSKTTSAHFQGNTGKPSLRMTWSIDSSYAPMNQKQDWQNLLLSWSSCFILDILDIDAVMMTFISTNPEKKATFGVLWYFILGFALCAMCGVLWIMLSLEDQCFIICCCPHCVASFALNLKKITSGHSLSTVKMPAGHIKPVKNSWK